jgi:hypothetical protein
VREFWSRIVRSPESRERPVLDAPFPTMVELILTAIALALGVVLVVRAALG